MTTQLENQSPEFIKAFLISSTVFLVIIIAYYILCAIAMWKIFKKSGEAGWKSLIPIYRWYIIYKMCWNTIAFRYLLAMFIIYTFAQQQMQGMADGAMKYALMFSWIVSGIVILVYDVKLSLKMSKSFGHGTGFGIGLLVLPNIFLLILGFGKSKYIGPQA